MESFRCYIANKGRHFATHQRIDQNVEKNSCPQAPLVVWLMKRVLLCKVVFLKEIYKFTLGFLNLK